MKITRFRDRPEAGQRLAEELTEFAGRDDVLVLALPRGGVPVAYEVARQLRLPLDVFVVRKLGVPGQEELAMGAIASGNIRVLNHEVIRTLQLPDEAINSVAAREQQELQRREQAYRDHRPSPAIEGRTVLLVDDGVATGSTMRAAIAALRQKQAARIIVATPTIARSTFETLRNEADEVVAVLIPEDFYGVGQWYENFSQTGDDEVRSLLQSGLTGNG